MHAGGTEAQPSSLFVESMRRKSTAMRWRQLETLVAVERKIGRINLTNVTQRLDKIHSRQSEARHWIATLSSRGEEI
jgi:hypothetical protein